MFLSRSFILLKITNLRVDFINIFHLYLQRIMNQSFHQLKNLRREYIFVDVMMFCNLFEIFVLSWCDKFSHYKSIQSEMSFFSKNDVTWKTSKQHASSSWSAKSLVFFKYVITLELWIHLFNFQRKKHEFAHFIFFRDRPF